MPLLIAEILQNQVSSTKLYVELNKKGNLNRNDNGGLGKKFIHRTRTQDVIDALDINDVAQTVTVPEEKISALYELAEKYKDGDGQSKKNENKYAICLALIFNATSDRRIKTIVLEELKALYGEEAKLKNQATGISGMSGMSILDIINLKLNALRRTATTVVPNQEIKATGEEFKNSTHSVRVVEYKGKDFIEKKHVHVRVAGVEAFSGTMMELFIGPHQPTTVQSATKKEIFKGSVRILSEKVTELKTFDNSIAFRKWVEDGFCGAAEVDIASAFMAEDDCHKGNIGYVLINEIAYAVRIDFDRTIAPISLVLLNPEWQDRIKCQGINKEWINIDGLKHLDGLELHEADLASLPILPIVTTTDLNSHELKKHFIPNNWWSYDATEWLKRKIENLKKNNKDFPRAQFQAILEKIILPEKIIDKIGFETIFNQQDYDKVVGWVKARQEKMKIAALKLPGFIDFILTEGGELAKEALKAKFRKFAEKRNDIFNDSIDYYLGFYDTNFNQFLRELPRDVRPSPEVKSTLSPERVSVSSVSPTTISPSIPISLSSPPLVLSQPPITPLAGMPSTPQSSIPMTMDWKRSEIPSLTISGIGVDQPKFVKNMMDRSRYESQQAQSLPVPPKPTSSWLKNGINLLLSVLGTGGAAALTYGLGFIGAVNIWNPIGWIAIGGAVILGAAIALGVKNKSKAWGILGLIPGFNILGSLVQPLTNAKKPSYTSVLTHSPTPSSVLSSSDNSILRGLPTVPNRGPIESKHYSSLNKEENVEPEALEEAEMEELIINKEKEIKNDFSNLQPSNRVDTSAANAANVSYMANNLNAAINNLTNIIEDKENVDQNYKCTFRKLVIKLIHLQILEGIKLMPPILRKSVHDLVFIEKNYNEVLGLSRMSSLTKEKVNKLAKQEEELVKISSSLMPGLRF